MTASIAVSLVLVVTFVLMIGVGLWACCRDAGWGPRKSAGVSVLATILAGLVAAWGLVRHANALEKQALRESHLEELQARIEVDQREIEVELAKMERFISVHADADE